MWIDGSAFAPAASISKSGSMLVEVKGGQVYVNGRRVEPTERSQPSASYSLGAEHSGRPLS